jgi:glycolate oxidase FAD binding subunit
MSHRDALHEFQQTIGAGHRFQIVGGGSKVGTLADGAAPMCTDRLQGIVEYNPSEFTITAMAGTKLVDLQATLLEHGQFMPFDPPRIDQGATLGGAVAAGISGPNRLRFGAIRDFILGVQMIDGTASLVRGGGKVVKNAAGFDLPKLMVGSWGSLGLMTEITIKVFPRPRQYTTVLARARSISVALAWMQSLATSPLDLDALDIEAPGVLLARLGGLPAATAQAAGRVRDICQTGEIIEAGPDEQAIWDPMLRWAWHGPQRSLIRVPLTIHHVEALDRSLEKQQAARRYSAAGNLVWIGWTRDRPLECLDQTLRVHGLVGRVLDPERFPHVLLGEHADNAMARGVRLALDPEEKFVRPGSCCLQPTT